MPGLIGRRGFALITVLWLVTVLTAIVGLAMAATRLGNQTTLNRIALARGRWAAEACFAVAEARWSEGRLEDSATIDLGRGTRCAWQVNEPSRRINFNTADPEVLRALGVSDTVIQALLDRRQLGPWDDLRQLAALPGWESRWDTLGTVVGPGVVDLSTAPGGVLRALPGLTPEAVDLILNRRRVGRPFTGLDALSADLSPPGRAVLLARYGDLARLATFAAPQLVVTATGWIESAAPRATLEVMVVPVSGRLAVVGRRMW